MLTDRMMGGTDQSNPDEDHVHGDSIHHSIILRANVLDAKTLGLQASLLN